MEKYLEGEELDIDIFKYCICKGINDLVFFFIYCGLFFKNKGVQLVFDVVVDYLFNLIEVKL